MRAPITMKGAQKLRDELDHLKSVKRPKVIAAIAEAREHGDLKENAEYHAAREEQGFIEGRIKQLEGELSHAEIIDVSKLNAGSKVVFGASVTLADVETDEEKKYQIVGDLEADIKLGLIAISSPVARAMIGKLEGDSIVIDAPAGHGVTTETFDQTRMPRIDQRQCVTDVQAGNRARRATQRVGTGFCRREGDHRAMQAILHLRRDQADHARVPIGVEQAGRHRSLAGHVQHHAGQRLLGVVSHRLLHGAPFRIDLLQRLRDVARLARVFGQQQRDAQRHVLKPACSVQAWAECEADVGRGQPRSVAAAGFDQRTQADTALPCA